MARIIKNVVDRRADIINAARELFKAKEYDKATIQDVMERLDIAKGTVYHYFESKEALLEAVVANIVDSGLERIKCLMHNIQGNALEKMRQLIEASDMRSGNEAVLDQLHKRGNEVLHTRLLAVTLIKIAPVYAEIIQYGCDEGIFQTSDALTCAEFILAGTQFLTDFGVYPWTSEDINRRVCALPQLIEQLLKAPQGSFQFITERMNSKIKSEL